jgi:hypothetical protein
LVGQVVAGVTRYVDVAEAVLVNAAGVLIDAGAILIDAGAVLINAIWIAVLRETLGVSD